MKLMLSRACGFLFPAILLCASFLFLYRLDHRPLWQDEAETACLARSVLEHGVPLAFDGKNFISQEEGREFGSDTLWRWSPWLQIYIAAGAFRVGGFTTEAGRFPCALAGLACVAMAFLLIRGRFEDPAWALIAALILATSVVFILFSRQCRYYSMGALLATVSVHAFLGDWQSRWKPAATLVLALCLLFYANYLLFFCYAGSAGLAAILVYRNRLPLVRVSMLAFAAALLLLPGIFLFRLGQQSGMLDFTLIFGSLGRYFSDCFQFIVPLPLVLVLLWKWRDAVLKGRLPEDPGERFALFLALIILFNVTVMLAIPQQEHRYLLHLYPLAAMLLAWVTRRLWNRQKLAAVLLGLMLAFTNWLHILPMDWLGIVNRPWQNGPTMLTSPNIPLRLFLTELFSDYPDVNGSLIGFFNAHARPGDTILTTYGDLSLQFYTGCRVIGGLQGPAPLRGKTPDWVVKRHYTRRNRELMLNASESAALEYIGRSLEYEAITLPCPDEMYGNRADPYYHRFIPEGEPYQHLVVYRRKVTGDEGSPP